jgi:hypothetical protein
MDYIDYEDDEYLDTLKIKNTDTNELLRTIENVKEIPLFLDGLFQSFIKDDYGHYGFTLLRRLQDVNAWIAKANNFLEAINYSLIKALQLNSDCQSIFFPLNVDKEYKEVFYYSENALYRLFSLWDILSHLYNHYFQMNIPIKRVSCYKVFSNKNMNKIEEVLTDYNGYSFKIVNMVRDEFNNIISYINEEYNYKDGITRGYHKYLEDVRNRSVHREDPHNFTVLNSSESPSNLPDAPLYELNCLVKDYFNLYNYLNSIFKLFYFDFKSRGLDVGQLKIKEFK